MIPFHVSRLIRYGCPMALALPLAGPASGDFLVWNASSGDWDTDANWVQLFGTNHEPDTTDTASISGSVDVTQSGEVAALVRLYGNGEMNVLGGDLTTTNGQIAYLDNTDNTVTVSGAGSAWDVTQTLRVGMVGTGELRVENNGIVTSTTGILGDQAGSIGTATVESGGAWYNTGDLFVGNAGTGTLTIGPAGTVVVGDTPAGAAPGFLVVNDSDPGGASGHLHIRNGGTLNLNGSAILGFSAGGFGYATVTGAGSTWSITGRLDVGIDGQGVVNIQDGGGVYLGDLASGSYQFLPTLGVSHSTESPTMGVLTVQNGSVLFNTGSPLPGISVGSAVLGSEAGTFGTATVTGVGSGWINDALLIVGDFGTGTLRVVNGGGLSAFSSTIGYESGSVGTATVHGAGSTWHSTLTLFVGRGGTGTLDVSAGGGVTSADGMIGFDAGSSGTATVTGAGSAWINTGDLVVGNLGEATLDIDAGGSVAVGDAAMGLVAPGLLIVNDSDPGGADGGHLRIQNGGTLNHYDSARLGHNFNEYGYATVTGAGSAWFNAFELVVGHFGEGTLNIEGGGLVSNTITRIGISGQIELQGGTLRTDALDILSGGVFTSGPDGVLLINRLFTTEDHFATGGHFRTGIDAGIRLAGHAVTVGQTFTVGGHMKVGTESGVILAQFIVDGGTLEVGAYLDVASAFNGDGGSATFHVMNGGTVTNGISSVSDYGSVGGADATLIVDGTGSTWSTGDANLNRGILTIGNGGTYRSTNFLINQEGTVHLNAGGNLFTETIDHTHGGTFNFTGGTVGVATFDGNLTNQGGTLRPGDTEAVDPFFNQIGTTTVTGDYTQQPGGTLAIELTSVFRGGSGASDLLGVAGDLTLAGTLEVTLDAGFPLVPGARADILDWGTINGAFDAVVLIDPFDDLGNAGLGLNLADLYTTGELSFELLGDANTDGYVGIEDLDLLLANWGDTVNVYDYAAGDLTGDGLVGDADLAVVQANWGSGEFPGGNVPEPGSLALLGLGGLALMHRRRQR